LWVFPIPITPPILQIAPSTEVKDWRRPPIRISPESPTHFRSVELTGTEETTMILFIRHRLAFLPISHYRETQLASRDPEGG